MLTLSQARAELGDLKVAHAAGTLAAAEAALREKLKPPPPPDPADASPLLAAVADDFISGGSSPTGSAPRTRADPWNGTSCPGSASARSRASRPPIA